MQTIEQFSLAGFTEQDIYALRAMKDGEATPEQQGLVMYAIIHKISKAWGNHYVPGSFDKTTFKLGKASTGQHLHYLITAPVDDLLQKIKTSEQTEKQ